MPLPEPGNFTEAGVLAQVLAPFTIRCRSLGGLCDRSSHANMPFVEPPPELIDGARVLYYAIAQDEPFFVMRTPEGEAVAKIYGLAICRYESGAVYRLSCSRGWETENDSHHGDDVENALRAPSGNYEIQSIHWIPVDD
jgi:hypothetical protein